jgi:hypothetical protein
MAIKQSQTYASPRSNSVKANSCSFVRLMPSRGLGCSSLLARGGLFHHPAKCGLRFHRSFVSAFLPLLLGFREQAINGSPARRAFLRFELSSVYDGRFANNGWLQELPKPITKLTWDNAALVSPKTAEKLGLTQRAAARGGEHGQILSNVIDIAVSNSKVTAAAWILPGQADGVIVLPLGYGRMAAGYTGSNKGFNAYAVRTSEALWIAGGGKVSKTGDDYPLPARNITSISRGVKSSRPARWRSTRRTPDSRVKVMRLRNIRARARHYIKNLNTQGTPGAWPSI